jgi:HlyD family secretion protein
VSGAQSQLDQAKLSRDRATLRAPFAGTIVVSNLDPGDNSAAAQFGGVVFRLVDTSKLHLDVNVSESDVSKVRVGQTGQVLIDALNGAAIGGRVTYIAPAATVVQNVRTYLVKIALPANNPQIRVGMSATVVIQVDK